MRPRHLIAVAVLLLFVVLAGVWVLTREDDSPGVSVEPNPDQVPRDIARTPDADAEDETEGPRRQPARPASPQDGPDDTEPEGAGVSVTGRVIDRETREPLPGTEIQLVVPGEPDESLAVTAADEEGAFRIELESLPDGAVVRAKREGYRRTEEPASEQSTTLELLPGAWVEVSFEDTSCVPEKVTFTWEGDSRRTGRFDNSSQTLRIGPMYVDQPQTGTVRAVWLDTFLEDDAVAITPGKLTKVELKGPSSGGTLDVRVIGPDALAMEGVVVDLRGSGVDPLFGYTDDTGVCTFTGVPSSRSLTTALRYAPDGAICGHSARVELESEFDHEEILFDLTGTTVVECRLTIEGEPVMSFFTQRQSGGGRQFGWFTGSALEQDAPRIYGLSPGTYSFTAYRTNLREQYTAVFEARTLPEVSRWEKNFGNRTVTVTPRGAPADADLVLEFTSMNAGVYEQVEPKDDGQWVLQNLDDGVCDVQVYGDGYSSQVVRIEPAKESHVEIEVVRSGTLKLFNKGGMPYIEIFSLQPRVLFRSVYLTQDERELPLPPGRYFIDGRGQLEGHVTISVGRTTEFEVGSETLCKIELFTTDGSSLTDYFIMLEDDGEYVRAHKKYAMRDGRPVLVMSCDQEGTFTLKIRRSGHKTLETEVELRKGEPLDFEVSLEPKTE